MQHIKRFLLYSGLKTGRYIKMGKREQHIVPKAYMKSWETRVTSNRELNKPFTGVNTFEKANLTLKGDGKNRGSILWEKHTYTVPFDDFIKYKANDMPKVANDFALKIENILERRMLSATYNGISLLDTDTLANHLACVNEWLFYDKSGELSNKKNKILDEIMRLNSYLIEDEFAGTSENYWSEILNKFIFQMENSPPISNQSSSRIIDCTLVDKILNMVFLLHIRNPEYDSFGILSIDKKIRELLVPFNGDGKEYFITKLRWSIWIQQVYDSLFTENGFASRLLEKGRDKFQILLLKRFNSNESFLTSDNPSFFDGVIYCPLTPQYLLLICKGNSEGINKIEFKWAKSKDIKTFNNAIINHSNKTIISIEEYINVLI